MEKTKIFLYAHFNKKEKFEYPKETYDCGVLFINESGSFQYRINNQQPAVINAGEAVYCPKGSTFHRKVITPVDLHMIKFEGTLPRQEFTINSRIKDNLKQLSVYIFNTEPEETPLVAHYCRDILYSLPQEQAGGKQEPILKYINDNLFKKLKNSDLNKILHCSEVSLISHVKSLTGKTPQQYISEKRVEAAKEMLLSGDEPISAVAAQCGFEDPLYFSKVFKKIVGMSPSEFKIKFKI